MRLSTAAGYALGAAAALVMLAGCTGGNSQMPPRPLDQGSDAGAQSVQRQVVQNRPMNSGGLGPTTAAVSGSPVTTPSFMDLSAVAQPLIFDSDPSGGAVGIFPQAGTNQKMIGQITGLTKPQGLATDTNGNLYVANSGSANVRVYAPPYSKAATLTLDDRGHSPYGVAVSPLGVVAVTDLHGSVSFYAKNATKACATVSDRNFPTIYYDAFDHNGNLYIDGAQSVVGSTQYTVVGEITGGCQAKKIALLLKPQISYAIPGGGVQIDKEHRIAIQHTDDATIETYNPPQNGTLGNPVSILDLKAGAAYDFAFLASGTELYNADCYYRQCSGALTLYDGYPETEPAENVIYTGHGPSGGLAATPPLVP